MRTARGIGSCGITHVSQNGGATKSRFHVAAPKALPGQHATLTDTDAAIVHRARRDGPSRFRVVGSGSGRWDPHAATRAQRWFLVAWRPRLDSATTRTDRADQDEDGR